MDIWPRAKTILKASQLLKKLYVHHMVRKYVREVTPQRTAQVVVQEAERFTVCVALRWTEFKPGIASLSPSSSWNYKQAPCSKGKRKTIRSACADHLWTPGLVRKLFPFFYVPQKSTLIPTVIFSIYEGVEDINIKVLQMIQHEHITVNCSLLFVFMLLSPYTVSPSQYSVPVVKYDRNGFRPHLRQLIFTQEAAYLVEEAKIKQRIGYSSLKGQQRENPSGTAWWQGEW